MFQTEAIDILMKSGLEEQVFPGAALSVGDRNGEIFQKVYGCRQIIPEKKPTEANTLFDIASLTKIVSTTFVALRLIQDGKLRLTDNLDKFF